MMVRSLSLGPCTTFLVVLAVLIVGSCVFGGRVADLWVNGGYGEVYDEPNRDERGKALHDELFVADLHADTLLWERDLIAGHEFGHVDMPKLVKGNVSLQAFTVATVTPVKLFGCISGAYPAPTFFLALMQLRLETVFSVWRRALHQAGLLEALDGKKVPPDKPRGKYGTEKKPAAKPIEPRIIKIIRTLEDLELVIATRAGEKPRLGVLLGLEGAHAMGLRVSSEKKVMDRIDKLHGKGFRMIALTHRFDNQFAGSSEGCAVRWKQYPGLTKLGEALIDKLHKKRILLDLAHLSSRALQQAAKIMQAKNTPVVVSHTGVQRDCASLRKCDFERNLSDEDVRAVVRADGVIGVGYWPAAVGYGGIASIVRAMENVRDIITEPDFVARMKAQRESRGRDYDPYEHIAFGSDFDGAVKVPLHAGQLARLTTALRDHRRGGRRVFPEAKIRLIAGANVCRVLATVLSGDAETGVATCLRATEGPNRARAGGAG